MMDEEYEHLNLPHLAARLFDTPLMVQPQKLNVIMSVLGPRLNVQAPVIRGATKQAQRPIEGRQITQDGIAVIPVYGSLVQRATGLDALSGLRTYAGIQRDFSDAMNSNDVRGVMFDIDSPGGEVNGVFDLAQMIADARGSKPIYARVNEHAYSAAYLLASATDQIFLPRTGGVGSIGVIAMHLDRSEFDAKEGYKFTTVYAGDRKNDFNPHEPLTDEAMNILREHVAESYDMFVDAVANYRGMSIQAVKDTKAGLFIGKSGTKAGLADKVASATEAYQAIVKTTATKRSNTAMSANDNTGGEETEVIQTASTETEQATATQQAAETETQATEQQTAEVVDLDKVRKQAGAEATTNERQRASAIISMCHEVGVPSLAGTLIGSGKPLDACREAAFQAKAAADDQTAIASHVTTDKPDGKPWAEVFAQVNPFQKK